MRVRWLGPLVLGLSAALYPLAASAAPPIEARAATVLEVSPSPDGVTVLLETIDPEQFADGVVASVDGRRVPASVERVSQRRPGSLVIVLETSSSMTGAIFGEARAVARGLIEAAPLGTPITLVTFDSKITVTRNQALDAVDLLTALDGLYPSGGAGLFDTVALVPKLIEPAPDPATVVLLTYGWDFGKVSALDGEQAIATAASVSGDYAAVVFGYTFDRQFFERLAGATQGSFLTSASQLDLTPLPSPSAKWEVQLEAPLLSAGPHTLQIASSSDDDFPPVEQGFDVSGVPAIQLEVLEAGNPTDPIPLRLGVTGPASADGLVLVAGSESTELSPETVDLLIDPWRFDPGQLTVRAIAVSGGRPVTQESTVVRIPELPPTIEASVSEPDGLPVVELVVQVQQPNTLLRVMSPTAEIATAARLGATTVLLPPGDWDGATVLLETEDGTAIQTGSIELTTSQAADSVMAWIIGISLLVFVSALAGGGLAWRRLPIMISRSLRRGAIGGAIVGALAIAVTGAVLLAQPGPVSVLVTVLFVFVGPGLAVVRWLPGADARDWILVPATGLALAALLSLGTLYAGWWDPDVLLVLLAVVTVGITVAPLRPRRLLSSGGPADS